jgi:hypothetical protein
VVFCGLFFAVGFSCFPDPTSLFNQSCTETAKNIYDLPIESIEKAVQLDENKNHRNKQTPNKTREHNPNHKASGGT